MKKNIYYFIIFAGILFLLFSCKKEDVKPQIITNTVTVIDTVKIIDTLYCIKNKEILYGGWIIYAQQMGSGNIFYYSSSQITNFNATISSIDWGSNHLTASFNNDYSIVEMTLSSTSKYSINIFNCEEIKLTQLETNNPNTALSYYLKRL